MIHLFLDNRCFYEDLKCKCREIESHIPEEKNKSSANINVIV